MNKIKVLLVEDETSLAMILSDTLEAQGFEMRTAHDGEEGLRMGGASSHGTSRTAIVASALCALWNSSILL